MTGTLYCKKDGKPMYLVEESERMSDGSHRITFYYRCPVCGYRITIEQIIIENNGPNIIVRRSLRVSP